MVALRIAITDINAARLTHVLTMYILVKCSMISVKGLKPV